MNKLANRRAIGSSTGIVGSFSNRFAAPPSNLAASVGITVTDTTTEIKTDTEIAMPISRNNCPTGKSRVNTGIKTMTVVNADPRIGPQT